MAHHILIPTDGSLLGNRAVAQGLAFASEIGARVTVLTVVEPFHIFSVNVSQIGVTESEYAQIARDQAAVPLTEAAIQARSLGVACETAQVEHDYPYEGIIEAAETHGCDMIAMASHGRSGLSAMVLGSETLKVLTHSKLPVLVFR